MADMGSCSRKLLVIRFNAKSLVLDQPCSALAVPLQCPCSASLVPMINDQVGSDVGRSLVESSAGPTWDRIVDLKPVLASMGSSPAAAIEESESERPEEKRGVRTMARRA